MDPLAPLRVVCLITGGLLHVAPIPTMRDITAHKSTLNYHVAPYASVLMNHFINGYYAYVRGDPALLLHRIVGVAANVAYVYIFMSHCVPARVGEMRRFCMRTLVMVLAMLAHLHLLLPLLGLGDSFFAHLALFGALTGIGLAASPLATVGDVLRNRDSSSLPAGLCLMVTVQCSAWSLYAWLRDDYSTLANNLVGVVLGSLQLALIASCPNRRAAAAKAAAMVDGAVGSAVAVKPVEAHAKADEEAVVATPDAAMPPGLTHR